MATPSSNLPPKRRLLLLAGCSLDTAQRFQEALGAEVRVGLLNEDDTMSVEMLAVADVLVLDSEQEGEVADRLAAMLRRVPGPGMLLVLGRGPVPEPLAKVAALVRRLPEPIDFSYIRGALDAAISGRHHRLRMDREQNRIRALYEISSALLKVTSRRHIAKALEDTLPPLLDASMVLLSFPTATRPVSFFHAIGGVGPRTIDALRVHLQGAWEVLRPDAKPSWEWVDSLLREGARPQDEERLRPGSFTTTPITRANHTEGFLTMLPRAGRPHDEAFLQTFFVIGDLLSVLVYNLHLKERLEERAMHDGLTQLLNRPTLYEHLEKECRRSQRYDTVLAVVMIDLDHFKEVNDSFGHQAGDEALRATARAIHQSIREIDLAGRWGGEEFLVVLPNTTLSGAQAWAERLRVRLSAHPVVFRGMKIPVTASMGVASAKGLDVDMDGLVARADEALYQAKSQGRNTVVSAK